MSDSHSAQPSVFLAYAAKPNLRAEAMRDTQVRLERSSTPSTTWEQLSVAGRVIISAITAAIDEADAVFAEVSDANSNVLFEAGYALARGKQLWLALDETDENALKHWREIAILSSIGRVDYSGDPDLLAHKWFTQQDAPDEDLLETLLSGGKPRQQDAIYAPSLPIKFQAAKTLEKYLERLTYLTILGSGDDLGVAPLNFSIKEIYRSSAAIFHLLAPNRVRSAEHNARASFLAGVAHGFDIPLLMVVEEGFAAPLDYRDLLFTYSSSVALQDHVTNWIENLPTAPGTNQRLGRMNLNVELPVTSFGQYVAEYERDELSQYFVETSEFRSIVSGASTVFVGRKGTGKTATMSQAVEELRKDRRNLVVSIKPSSYEFGGLTEIVSRLGGKASSDYLLLSIWTYLLYTEIGLRIVSFATEQPARGGADTVIQQLAAALKDVGAQPDEDISIRLESLIVGLEREARRDGEDLHDFIARNLRTHKLAHLRPLIASAMRRFDRVAVLIDNLDKTWERGSDYGLLSQFILSLLTAIGTVQKDFAKTVSEEATRITLTVFLRTDIYDSLARFAREPDKIGAVSVHWHDEELLVRVLEERYVANRPARKRSGEQNMWTQLFDPEVRGISTRDYLLWRALPRPRDFVFFANAAVTTAINRKHATVSAADIAFAERQYSRFAVEALLVESVAEIEDLEEALYEFAGVVSTLTDKDLDVILSPREDGQAIRDWLVRSGFLGIEVRAGEYRHVEGEDEARKAVRLARRFAKSIGGEITYRVHPAYRADLEIRDDDLHDDEIKDVTLQY